MPIQCNNLQLITMSVPVSEHEVVRIYFRMQSRKASIFSRWKIERCEIVRTNLKIQRLQTDHTSSRIKSRETTCILLRTCTSMQNPKS